MGRAHNLRIIVVALASFIGSTLAHAQNNYVPYELIRENNWDTLITEDLNGDGAKDLIFSHFQAGIGRELHVHHQQADGNFASTPQRIEIKTEIIAVGFADLRTDPGVELVLLANNGVFSLSSAVEGYAGNIKDEPFYVSYLGLVHCSFTVKASLTQFGQVRVGVPKKNAGGNLKIPINPAQVNSEATYCREATELLNCRTHLLLIDTIY